MKKNFLLIMLIFFICFSSIILFGCSKTKDTDWVITEYADNSGNQGMFYTIYSESQRYLIVIDGGWNENTEQVRKVIASYGNHVNNWIITHYHSDHVDAVNSILSNLEDITIDSIYDSPMDYNQYQSIAKEWDNLDSYFNYIELTENMEIIHHVQRDETLSLNGLNITFYNTYDNLTNNIEDIPNNAGLVFKLQGTTSSMLFMSDCHSEQIANILIERYNNELSSDYLQAAHHGNASNWKSICDIVSPKLILLDGPKWLMEGENYKAKDIIEWCNTTGIEYKNFENAPNQIIIN